MRPSFFMNKLNTVSNSIDTLGVFLSGVNWKDVYYLKQCLCLILTFDILFIVLTVTNGHLATIFSEIWRKAFCKKLWSKIWIIFYFLVYFSNQQLIFFPIFSNQQFIFFCRYSERSTVHFCQYSEINSLYFCQYSYINSTYFQYSAIHLFYWKLNKSCDEVCEKFKTAKQIQQFLLLLNIFDS